MTMLKTHADAAQKTATMPTIQKRPEMPEKQGGPARMAPGMGAALPPPNGNPPPARAADLMTDSAPDMGARRRAQMSTGLQQTVGNARIARMMGMPIQTKLTVGAPNDVYEQEADQVANQVMRMAEPPTAEEESVASQAPIQRQLATQEQATAQRQSALEQIDTTTETLQTQTTADAPPEVTPEVESHVTASRGGGEPLAESARAFAEPRFGQDFGDVRVHTDAQSNRAAQAINAQAFTTGQDIYFGAGRYQPGTQQGNRLLAHELTHVVQQGKSLNQNSPSALQRQNTQQPSPRFLPHIPDFEARVSPGGGVLSFRLRRHVILQTAPEARTGRVPFTYQYLPAMPMLRRNWPVIRLVVAPGVAVRLEGYPSSYIASDDIPAVEIYRVQDPELLPAQGEPIDPANYTGVTPIRPDQERTTLFVTPPPVTVMRRADGVDIVHHESRLTLRVTAPMLRSDARFAYEVTLGSGQFSFGSFRQLTTIRVVKTPSVQILLVATRGQVFVDPRIEVYEVDSVNQVPAQGQPLRPVGREIRNFPAEAVWTLEQTLSAAALDTGIGAIPIVGDLVDVAEFVYGAATGRDRWGRPLSDSELALMGIGALIPIASGSLLRSGGRLARELGQNADHIRRLIRGVENLSEADLQHVRRWEEMLRHGERIPAAELPYAQVVLRQIDRVVTTAETGRTAIRRTLDDLLNAERTGFTHAGLQEAYQQYAAGKRAAGQAVATPEEWARLTRGSSREILESLLGADFARVTRTGESVSRFVRLTDIPQPTSYTPERLAADLQMLSQHRQQVLARLGNLTSTGIPDGTINQSLFNILKGNIAEVLAGARQGDVLAQIRRTHPNAQLMSGIRARLVRADGSLSDALLFTDNIIATQNRGNLYVHAVFEVKSGPGGGAEATSQIHRWIEQHLDDGFEIQLNHGERFRYAPDAMGRGRVIGLARAERQVITPSGAEHLGLRSADQVAAPTSRHALAQTADEISFLARTVLENMGL